MNGRKEIIAQGVLFALITLGSILYRAVEYFDGTLSFQIQSVISYCLSSPSYFTGIIALPVFILLVYNIAASGIWWICVLLNKKNSLRFPTPRTYPNNIIVLLVVLLIVTPVVIHMMDKRLKEAVIYNALKTESSTVNNGYKVFKATEVTNDIIEAEIKEIRLHGDYAIVEYDDGVLIMAVIDLRKRVIALEKM